MKHIIILSALLSINYALMAQTIRGDVNLDGEVNVEDVNTVVDIILQKDKVEPKDPFNGHDYVDMGTTDKNGRPLYWATCNVGATQPTQYGHYFAWGETEGYENPSLSGRDYDHYSHKYYDPELKQFTKYCTKPEWGLVDYKTEIELSDDAARVNMGGNWRMPTVDEMQELKDNCTWLWAVDGYLVKSKINGNFIFLPATGGYWWMDSMDNDGVGYIGDYWLSSIDKTNPYSAKDLVITAYEISIFEYTRWAGFVIRAVCTK